MLISNVKVSRYVPYNRVFAVTERMEKPRSVRLSQAVFWKILRSISSITWTWI